MYMEETELLEKHNLKGTLDSDYLYNFENKFFKSIQIMFKINN